MRISKKIFYDISLSDICVNIDNYKFYFSSDLYRDKFISNYQNFVKAENDKINVKYKMSGDFKEYLTIIYYMKIEKRGFRVYYKDKLLNPSSFVVYGN